MSSIERGFSLLADIDSALSVKIRHSLAEGRPLRLFSMNYKDPCIFQINLRGTSQLLSMESKQLGDYQAYSSEARVQQEDSMGIGHEEHGDADCHVKLLLQELHDHINSHSTSYPEDSARINVQSTILILLGVPDIGSILAVVKQFKPLAVWCLYQELSEWDQWLLSPHLITLRNHLRQNHSQFKSQYAKDYKLILRQSIGNELLGCVGNMHLIYDRADQLNDAICRGIQNEFLPLLRSLTGGPCVDELMMLKHTHLNIRHRNSRFLCKRRDIDDSDPFIIVGSGPSLDNSIDTIKLLQNDCHIISAGSSIGTLMDHGVEPDFHVHVERGGDGEATEMYTRMLAANNRKTFQRIVGILPTSIEPTLLELYEYSLLYAREGQSPIAAWPWLNNSILAHEGPQCVSAAFAFVVNLKPSQIYLFGCDLGSASQAKSRSKHAVGDGTRIFSRQVPGNLSPIVYTNNEITQQILFMQAALNACSYKPLIFNSSDGVLLPFATPLSPSAIQVGSVKKKLSAQAILLLKSSAVVREAKANLPANTKEWIKQWIELGESAVNLPLPLVRIRASQLLMMPKKSSDQLTYRIFRGTIRDGFWLTSHAAQYSETTHEARALCWTAFVRMLTALELELKNIESLLEAKS